MPASDEEKTARFNAVLDDCPDLSPQDIATYAERSVKTIYMWRRGRPAAIPFDTLRLLEHVFLGDVPNHSPLLDPEDVELLGEPPNEDGDDDSYDELLG